MKEESFNKFARDHTIWKEFNLIKKELAHIRRLIMLTMPPEIANKVMEENMYQAQREYQAKLAGKSFDN